MLGERERKAAPRPSGRAGRGAKATRGAGAGPAQDPPDGHAGAPRAGGPDPPRPGPVSTLGSLADPATLRQFVRNLKEGVYVTTPDGTILDANPAFLEMIGVGSLEELATLTAERLVVRSDQRADELRLLASEGGVREFELQIRRPDGEVRTVLDTAYQVTDPATGETFYHGILVDISDRKELEEQLREASVRDPLTGCYNRRHLGAVMRGLDAAGADCGAIVADVDHFKEYNDRYGHRVGDQVLVRLARFLMRQARAEDAVFRIGGDEFLVLITGPDAATTESVAKRLRQDGPESAPVSFSLGWARRRRREKVERTIARADAQLIHVRVVARGVTGARSGDRDDRDVRGACDDRDDRG